jgi:copper homeostasis protein
MLEVCVESLEAAIVAVQAGANRIELSQQLDVGGLTPSDELIQAVRSAINAPLIVLIRNRPGDFVFGKADKDQMVKDALRAMRLGADGIAIGGLLPNRDLDREFLLCVAEAIPEGQLVMHRAFDSVRDPEQALEQLIELGFHRILTSGGPTNAIDGLVSLQQLQQWTKGRIEILPAGGINAGNAMKILSQTQCNQLHGSFRSRNSLSPVNKLPDAETIQQIRHMLV